MGNHAGPSARRPSRTPEWWTQYRLFVVTGAVVLPIVVAGVAVAVEAGSSAPINSPNDRAVGCTNGACAPSFSLPSATVSPSSHSAAKRHKPTARPTATKRTTHFTAATPKPTTTAVSPAPLPKQSGPVVTVAYTVVQHWGGGFQGRLTITNHGAAAISGWQLELSLPDDEVTSAWQADWQTDGDNVVFEAPDYDRTIAAGATKQVSFSAQGDTTSPASCTFDGAACQ
jgi:cellulase/cellobiase CelA1